MSPLETPSGALFFGIRQLSKPGNITGGKSAVFAVYRVA